MTKTYDASMDALRLSRQFFDMCAPGPRLGLDACYRRLSGPPTVMWDVTNRCSLACLHCYNRSGADGPVRDLDTEGMLRVADQIREVRPFVVCLCGGEPALRGDLEVLAGRLKTSVPHVNLVTNGWVMTRERIRSLRESGIGSIQVSLDGATALTHDNIRGHAGSFDQAVNAIRLLVEAGCDPPVTLIPNRLNMHEITEWAELCIGLGVRTLRLMPTIPIGRARDNRGILELNADDRLRLRAELRELQLRRPGLNLEWGDPMEHIYNFSDPGNTMRTYSIEIRSDGRLVVSTYLPLLVGDLARHTLKEYWAAGLGDVWRHPRVVAWAQRLRSLDDMASQDPQPWCGDDLEWDLVDEAAGRPRAAAGA